MGTPIRSEVESQNQESQESQQTPPLSQDSTTESQQNESSQTPPASATDENTTRYVLLLEEQLREQNRQIQELSSKVSTPSSPSSSPSAPVSTDEARQQFYNDPVGVTRNIVKEALDQTIAPLTQFVSEFRGGNKYDKIKGTLKLNPRFSPHWGADVEQALDGVMQSVAPEHVNDQTVQAALVQVIGMKAMGMLPNGTPTSAPPPAPSPAPTTPMPITPPHMRPSAPPGPNTNPNAKVRRQLTELEKRLARENNMTDAQYLDWLEMPAAAVTKVDISKVGSN